MSADGFLSSEHTHPFSPDATAVSLSTTNTGNTTSSSPSLLNQPRNIQRIGSQPETPLLAAQSLEPQPLETQTDGQPIEAESHPIVSGSLLSLLILWVAAIGSILFMASRAWLVIGEIWKSVQMEDIDPKLPHRIPCRNCRYFSRSYYLKCAVRPHDALTNRAIDCSDYVPECSKTSNSR